MTLMNICEMEGWDVIVINDIICPDTSELKLFTFVFGLACKILFFFFIKMF
jgi:hypothetical protein